MMDPARRAAYETRIDTTQMCELMRFLLRVQLNHGVSLSMGIASLLSCTLKSLSHQNPNIPPRVEPMVLARFHGTVWLKTRDTDPTLRVESQRIQCISFVSFFIWMHTCHTFMRRMSTAIITPPVAASHHDFMYTFFRVRSLLIRHSTPARRCGSHKLHDAVLRLMQYYFGLTFLSPELPITFKHDNPNRVYEILRLQLDRTKRVQFITEAIALLKDGFANIDPMDVQWPFYSCRLALAMATHPRLGRDSPLYVIDMEILMAIVDLCITTC